MRESDPEHGLPGSSKAFCSMGRMRSVGLVLTAIVTLGCFLWMFLEDYKIEMCTAQHLHTFHIPLHVNSSTVTPSTPPSPYEHWDYNWDRKAFKDPSEAKGVATRTLILVRHGKYDFPTGKLDELGRKQANHTALRLMEINHPYQSIVHSTLDRAIETAQIIHQSLPHVAMVADAILEEGGPVPPEPTVNYWALPDRTYHVDGPRLESAFRKYFYRADKKQTTRSFEIFVAHGNVFRYFILRALQLPPQAWMRYFIAHASISVLNINPDGTVTMDHLGDCGHLPPSLVTY